MNLIEQITRARKRATPLLAVKTPNWQETSQKLAKIKRKTEEDPVIVWDFVQGVTALNQAGAAITSNFMDSEEDMTKRNPIAFLSILAEKVPAGTEGMYMFLLPKDEILDGDSADPGIIQAISNLREPLKTDGASLVLLGSDISLPPFLRQDVVVFSDPLPDEEALGKIVDSVYKVFKGKPEEKTRLKAIDCLRGLSEYLAEQSAFMCMDAKTKTIDLDMLWNQKREVISQTKGLSLHEGSLTFDDVRGLESIKDFMTAIFNGKKPPRLLVFIDEIEKALAGTESDASGTSMDQLGVALTEMQNNKYTGIICVGHAGTGKSFIAQTTGATFSVPTLVFDFGGMKGKGLVGQAENEIRRAFDIVKAISGGDALFIATSNKIANLPVALRRRFKLGTYFFDLPNKDGRNDVWKMYKEKFELKDDNSKIDFDEGYTPAEIENCCEIAWRTGLSLKEASKRITPVCQAMPEQIMVLRKESHNRYLDATKPGIYKMEQKQKAGQRKIAEEDHWEDSKKEEKGETEDAVLPNK
jgi:hypothetical protein